MAHPILSQLMPLIGSFLTVDYGTAQAMTLGTVVQAGDPDRIVLRGANGSGAFVIRRARLFGS